MVRNEASGIKMRRLLLALIAAVALSVTACSGKSPPASNCTEPAPVLIPKGCSFPAVDYSYHEEGTYDIVNAPGGGVYEYLNLSIVLPPGRSFFIHNYAPMGMAMFDIEVDDQTSGASLLLERNQRDREPTTAEDRCVLDFIELNWNVGPRPFGPRREAEPQQALANCIAERFGVAPDDQDLRLVRVNDSKYWFESCSEVDCAIWGVSASPNGWMITPCGNLGCSDFGR